MYTTTHVFVCVLAGHAAPLKQLLYLNHANEYFEFESKNEATACVHHMHSHILTRLLFVFRVVGCRCQATPFFFVMVSIEFFINLLRGDGHKKPRFNDMFCSVAAGVISQLPLLVYTARVTSPNCALD